MSTPVLHLLAGPDGSGKTTFVERVLAPVTGLHFVNADHLAAQRWPGDEESHAYEASRVAAAERARLLAARSSFITETVFSHVGKVELVERAVHTGYLVQLHVVMVPVELSVARVAERVRRGGHTVPEQKVRDRHARLWPLVVAASAHADRTIFYDNTYAHAPFTVAATLDRGRLVGDAVWPTWTPDALTDAYPTGLRR